MPKKKSITKKDVKTPRNFTTRAVRAFHAPPELCRELQRIGVRQSIAAGTILFEKDEPNRGLFVVLAGRFALSSGDDPARVTRIAEKECLLGLPATVRDQPYSLTAEAVTDGEVCRVSPAQFRELVAADTALGMTILVMLADEVFQMRRMAVFTSAPPSSPSGG